MSSDLPILKQQEIVDAFSSNPEVFEEVYNHYFEAILKFLAKKTMSADIAYDLTSETFLKAFNTFHKFKWTGISIKVWLYRIATNVLYDHYRRAPREPINVENMEVHEALVTDSKEELELLNQTLYGDEELQALSKAMERLNPKYQQVVSLYYFSGLSQAEIGDVLNKNSGAVKAMMHRAIEQLRSEMKHSTLQ